jgi:L-ascorbate metabolism protein UlaG (beta-lactamase superfamily)
VELLKPKIVIPMHYNTFPPIRQDPEKFREIVSDRTHVEILQPGEELDI